MKKDFSRRKFLQTSSLAIGGIITANSIRLEANPLMESAKKVVPSDTLRFAMIGVGMQGSGLLAQAITLPGVVCVGAAELYDGRQTLAKEITGNPNLLLYCLIIMEFRCM